MKEIGRETTSKEWAMSNFPMVAVIWVNTSTASLRELESTLGQTGNFMMVNGLTV